MGSFRKVLFFISINPFAFGPRTEVAQVRTSQVIGASDGTTRPPRTTPGLASVPAGRVEPGTGPGNPGPGITHEVDPDFLENIRREAMDQPELPWEP